ncbi:helix-turn-helix domain-containing protein [Streptomyces sp. NPDC055037]
MALRSYAADLRFRREAAGLTMAEAAQALGVHEMTVSRLERAMTAPRPATVSHLLHLYGVTDLQIQAALHALDDALRPGWWHPYRAILPGDLAGVIDLESAAGLIRSYAPGVVPELLQTPDYARALLRLRHPHLDAAHIDQRLELLAERQRHTLGRERPLRLWALIEETVLTRQVGNSAVMREQIERLDQATEHRGPVTVQLIRAQDGPHPLLLSGPADVIRLDHARLADRLIVRGLHIATATVTEEPDAVRTYQAAMDTTATLALPPTTRIPPRKGQR